MDETRFRWAVSESLRRNRTGESRATLVKVEDTQRASISGATAVGAKVGSNSGATRAIAADELDPGRERRPLESYFQEIGGT